MSIKLERVRPHILRAYYEATYARAAYDGAFDRASQEEYLALARIQTPAASDKFLLSRAPVPQWKAASEQASDVFLEQPPRPRWQHISKKPRVDLGELANPSSPNIILERVKNVLGLDKLRNSTVERLYFQACDSTERSALHPPLQLSEIHIRNCEEPWASVVLESTSGRKAWIEHDSPTAWNAKILSHMKVTELQIQVPVVVGLSSLAEMQLERAYLSCVADIADLVLGLASSSRSLESLVMHTATPFRPNSMNELQGLKHLQIAAYPEYREEWIAWAVEHPSIRCIFSPPSEFDRGEPLTLASMHRGVPILVARPRGGPPKFRVEHDLVDECNLPFDDNGELEDVLRVMAKKQGKKVQWGSEASTFVATAADLSTCQWLIDQALEPGTARLRSAHD